MDFGPLLFAADASPDSHAIQLLAGGILSVMIIREVLNFLKYRKETNGNSLPSWVKDFVKNDATLHEELKRMMIDLHHWHQPDEAGEQAWKNKSMILAVADLKGVVKDNSDVIAKLTIVIERFEEFEKQRLRFTDRELERMHHDRAEALAQGDKK